MLETVYTLMGFGECIKCKAEHYIAEISFLKADLDFLAREIERRNGLLTEEYLCETCGQVNSVYLTGKIERNLIKREVTTKLV